MMSLDLYVQKIIWSTPTDKKRMLEAFTHKSYSAEQIQDTPNNQRLEFLGDSVLGLVVADQLYQDYPHYSEAEMTLRKISLIREETLCMVAKEIGLDMTILIGKWEEKKGGRSNPAILGDSLEALIGYLYIDFGYDVVQRFIVENIYSKKDSIQLAWSKPRKSLLQEKLQDLYKQLPLYRDEEIFRDDKKNLVEYKSTVYLWDQILGVGYGTNKKKAQEDAAKHCLDDLL